MYSKVGQLIFYENIFSFLPVNLIVGLRYFFFPNVRRDLRLKMRYYNLGWIIANILFVLLRTEEYKQIEYEYSLIRVNEPIVRTYRVRNALYMYWIGMGIDDLIQNPAFYLLYFGSFVLDGYEFISY